MRCQSKCRTKSSFPLYKSHDSVRTPASLQFHFHCWARQAAKLLHVSSSSAAISLSQQQQHEQTATTTTTPTIRPRQWPLTHVNITPLLHQNIRLDGDFPFVQYSTLPPCFPADLFLDRLRGPECRLRPTPIRGDVRSIFRGSVCPRAIPSSE